MSDTPRNKRLSEIIRESLAQTRAWSWSDEDRRLSAGGAALKYVVQHSDLDEDVAIAVVKLMVKEIMTEEEPAMRPCPYCGGTHPVADLEAGWHCPMERDHQS